MNVLVTIWFFMCGFLVVLGAVSFTVLFNKSKIIVTGFIGIFIALRIYTAILVLNSTPGACVL